MRKWWLISTHQKRSSLYSLLVKICLGHSSVFFPPVCKRRFWRSLVKPNNPSHFLEKSISETKKEGLTLETQPSESIKLFHFLPCQLFHNIYYLPLCYLFLSKYYHQIKCYRNVKMLPLIQMSSFLRYIVISSCYYFILQMIFKQFKF